MSEKEYKIKCENLFKKNTILLNQQQIDAEHIRALQKQNGELTDKVNELELKIKHLTQHLEPQSITALFEQVEEEVRQEQKIKELEEQIEKMINEIDKTMVLSNMCEYEICDILDIFRKYGFKRNDNDIWEIKE